MSDHLTRRRFLASTTLAAAAFASAAAKSSKPASAPATVPYTGPRLNIAIIGAGGRGMDHVREIHALPQANVIALCDVDSVVLANAAKAVGLPAASTYNDFRAVLMLPNLAAVVVATPDHTHAVITAAALRAGKHVYCEKPLCHTIAETRAIAQLAEETKLVTQTGIQIHAMDNYRRVVEIVQSGAIGPVHEVHIWNNRVHKEFGLEEALVPPQLNYDLWLGPVPYRPFHKGFHPYSWREWWSFASSLLGDIGSHLFDVAFWSLDLKYPTRIAAQGGPMSDDLCAKWIVASYDFPARGDHPPVKLTWYDPPKKPPAIAQWKLPPKLDEEGVMFIGEKGMLYTNYGERLLLPAERFKDFKNPTTRIASSPGHQAEWINACLGRDPKLVSAPFSYGALLTETALLGTIAFRTGKTLDWDAKKMRFRRNPEADKLLSSVYRPGWTM